VIGFVASKLVETFHPPAIVLSKGEKHSKASARSISGFNIIEFIRNHEEFLVNAGGHPMAAGFTVETEKLLELQSAMELLAEKHITDELLVRSLKIDCEMPIEVINQQMYDALQQLSPFGMANPEPVFVSRDVVVENVRQIGMEGKHLKLELRVSSSQFTVHSWGKEIENVLTEVQGDLFEIGANLANPKASENPKLMQMLAQHIKGLEDYIDELTLQMPELTHFILPGGGNVGAFLQLARTVSRRAERSVITLGQTESIEAEIPVS